MTGNRERRRKGGEVGNELDGEEQLVDGVRRSSLAVY